jgi:hypothetical protein
MPSAPASWISCWNVWPARIACADVEIVLVLGRLLRLRLDQDRAFEAYLLLVLDDHRQKTAELRELTLHVRVQKRLVALAPAPQHVVRTLELVGNVERVLHLRGGIREHIRVGVGGGARHEAAVGEHVRRPPEELHLRLLHFLRKDGGDLANVLVRLGEARAFRGDVAVVEREERNAQKLEHLERDVGLELRLLHAVAEPGADEGRAAERVGARPGKTMPVADGEAEMVLHPLAEYFSIRIVEAEGEGVAAFRPFVADGLLVAEKAGTHCFKASLMAG